MSIEGPYSYSFVRHTKKGISVVTGDYNSTKIEFEFDESAENGIKMFEMKNPSEELVYADEIVDNEVILVGYKEEDGEEIPYSLFGEEGDYTFEVSLYHDGSKLTSVCEYITARKEEVIVDGEVVESEITLFDNLMNELEENIGYVENLDIDAEKVEHTTTVSITRKDGTPKEVEILDGKSIEYDWEGTSLGIRQEGESTYEYTNLQGPKGDAGAIKFEIVQELPITGTEDTIYLVPIEPDTSGNNYAEYIYVNGQWELLGRIGVQVQIETITNQEIDEMWV